MNLMWLKQIAVGFETKRQILFRCPLKKQEKYLSRFRHPRDEIERSYFQYCCQMKLYGTLYHAILNLAALPLSLVLLHKYKKVRLDFKEQRKGVFVLYDMPENIAPRSLSERYPDMLPIRKMENCLCAEDVAFLEKIFRRYPFSWLFWMKCIIKVSQYSALICRYRPEAIVSREEFSFTSSAITRYCRERSVRRINVMHGEKLFFIRDSFVSFDEFFVWSQEYVDLFLKLRAEESQFRVEVPPSLLFEKQSEEKCFDFTYYLQDQAGDKLQCIVDAMKRLSEKGMRVAIRPHPRFTPIEALERFCSGSEIEIENTKKLSIEDSLRRTRCAVSVYSTVLQQAHCNGIDFAIDDVTEPRRISQLAESGFVMLQKPHKKLSSILEQEKPPIQEPK